MGIGEVSRLLPSHSTGHTVPHHSGSIEFSGRRSDSPPAGLWISRFAKGDSVPFLISIRGFARSIIVGTFLLEVLEDTLGAIGSPQGEQCLFTLGGSLHIRGHDSLRRLI
jgi:hypothetical protein